MQDYRVKWRVRRWLIGLLVLHGIWAAVFIDRTGVEVGGKRYWCLYDDAMITLCFANNLANGHGLVWTPGSGRVEGFTCPLWTFFLSVIASLGLDKSTTCLVIQIIEIPIVWGTAIAAARLARAVGCAPPAQILAAAWTLVYRNLNFFALTGMETGPAALVLTAGLIGVVHGVRTGRGSVASMWWTAPAILLRPEMAAFAVYAGAVQFVMLERRRWRPVIGLAIGLAICGGYVLWRRSYYGEWLPNTYVLKLTQWPFSDRMRAASRYLPWTLASLGPFALAGLTSIKHWRGSRFWLLWIVPVLGIAYQFYVGGYYERTDRFAVPFGPTLFVAAAAGVVHISRYVRQLGFGVRRVWVVWAAGLLMVAPMNAAALNPILKGVGTWKVMEGSLRNWRAAIIINRHAAPDATIAVTWAGTVPYITGRTCRDILGRCDRDIARLPAHLGLYPGHNKFDVSWTVRTYEPDIIDDTSDAVIATAAVKANYVPMRFELDGEPVYLLVRKYTHRITGGVAIAWRELPRDNP